MNQIRISGKNLGQLSLPSFCPRCFWIRLKCGNKLPFQVFPGIFSSIDAFSKKITNAHFRTHKKIPRWFDGFGDLGEPIQVPHHTKFNIIDSATGILLTGVPDELLRRTDSGLFVADYKTALHSDNQDELLPMYETQLNAYAIIAQRIGMGRVNGLGLIYYEPPGEIDDAALDSSTVENGFIMTFAAKLLPIPMEPAKIPPLLARARELQEMPSAPEGRTGCKDCTLLARLLEIA